jgi:hypothetical protein
MKEKKIELEVGTWKSEQAYDVVSVHEHDVLLKSVI